MTLQVVQIDPLDPAQDPVFLEWHRVLDDVAAEVYGDWRTIYSPTAVRARHRFEPTVQLRELAAIENGAVVGTLETELPLADNRHRVELYVTVRRDRRRRGVGSRLLMAAHELAAEAGRTVLGAYSEATADGDSSVAYGFASRYGFEVGQTELRSDLVSCASDRRARGSVQPMPPATRHTEMAAPCAGDTLRLAGHPAHVVGAALTALKSRPRKAEPVAVRDLDALCIKGWSKMRPCWRAFSRRCRTSTKTQDQRQSLEHRGALVLPVAEGRLSRLEAVCRHATDYEVLTSVDGIPDEWLAGRADLARWMSVDVPLGGLDYREERWDEARVRRTHELARAQGRRTFELIARSRTTGELIGYTTLHVPAHTPRQAVQWDTLVRDDHRGHRLGLALKIANLRALGAELPSVERISTWNAQENEPMLRVNRDLGFEVVGSDTEWQKRLS